MKLYEAIVRRIETDEFMIDSSELFRNLDGAVKRWEERNAFNEHMRRLSLEDVKAGKYEIARQSYTYVVVGLREVKLDIQL